MHSITGKLNKAAQTFQAGDSTGFNVRIGVKFRDRKTGTDAWTNYTAVVFAKSQGQVDFYKSVLVEGSIVELSAQQLKVDDYRGSDGTMAPSIEMINCQLGYVFNPNQSGAPQQQNNNQQQQYQQAPQNNNQQQQYQQAPNQQQQQYQQAPQQGGYGNNRG